MAGARLARRLTLVEGPDGDGFMEKALKVAFATTDQIHVDQHFGSAVRFAVYHVTMDEARFAEAIAFEAASQDGNEDKLAARIAALAGCAAVYCQAVGASAIGQLKTVGVQPLKVAPGTPIKAQLSQLQQELREGPALWIVRALSEERDPNRFDDMEAEGWSE
ncbi:NifB/NifX family molybdenum-iron cluster-binding protein [Rhodobium gokarnense]|uniref:Nitrogen fixation protein NifX n=1 Tax=Rhodobium gokarnense TaxID=364296 RepID=A0ABT3H970_9HYPH|nr:NifB/NifX family molybdenum-iron cluster-binding protein [Rhodobium gokarnense]MCW2306904.1 nitrogen fixation protein NifX [Rhodobium gokarnense]